MRVDNQEEKEYTLNAPEDFGLCNDKNKRSSGPCTNNTIGVVKVEGITNNEDRSSSSSSNGNSSSSNSSSTSSNSSSVEATRVAIKSSV